jgi:hypothetical protein
MLDLLFLLVNLIPLPFWFLMILLPRRRVTRQVTSNYAVFIVLGAIYIFVIVGAITAGLSAVAAKNEAINLFSLAGLLALLGTPAGILAVWTHMVIQDLVAGYWIYHEAQRQHAPTLFTSVALFFTLLLGPLGVFIFVLWLTLVRMRVHDTVERIDRENATITTPGV